ncbi:GTP-binding protein Obg [Cordyceps fumosorosea ARSEF 2679]|uniref:GTP-binding protein Obg n=1 Tax=Cordyceps fumosorosea (strain ARSEF 2679) TaxID=1081104 RepID=A0A162JHA4_CORFA|nr:GTP-binding protein Obg [Cordyceps fumosorosea ARSEF 2679]OAA68972.1 GTP-binding protein Obg [Cordyceps fumosorosea ARSEF 2679]
MAAVVATRRPRHGARTILATAATLAPFLYPSLLLPTPTRAAGLVTAAQAAASAVSPSPRRAAAVPAVHARHPCQRRFTSTTTTAADHPIDTASSSSIIRNDLPESRLNPAPDDYAAPTFADRAELTLYAGRGGNGCVSFLREAYLPDGPPNGGDGGAGGNIYIQAAHGETSLHKIARRRFIRAGRGRHGQGSAKSGTRGEDIVITVPVGTVIRELERTDPVADEALSVKLYRAEMKARRRREIEIEDEERRQRKLERLRQEKLAEEGAAAVVDGEEVEDDPLAETDEWEEDLSSRAHARMARYDQLMEEEAAEEDEIEDPQRHKWLLYPGMSKTDAKSASFPRMPRRTRLLSQPPAPIQLDLSRPTPRPILLAAGGVGGLGNAHFCSREHPRPVFATRGDDAVTLRVSLELKLLADVGLVGLPNAGKSTLLRALTNSRARVGSWAFTTLQPNIGTIVLDKYSGRPIVPGTAVAEEEEDDVRARTRFTVADIPGLIEGAHLDRGLGIAFLRHVERAGVLAFVVDLAAGDAVAALQALWREVALYAAMRDEEERARAAIRWDDDHNGAAPDPFSGGGGPVNLETLPDAEPSSTTTTTTTAAATAGKPWFVVATKADKPETRANFAALKAYLEEVTAGEAPHPSGLGDGAWTKRCAAIPVSAIHGQGVDRVVRWMVGLLGEHR